MAEPERKCSTCKFYEPAPIWRKGWCRNPLLYAPQQSHLVAEDDLDCSRGLSDYWEAADGTGPNAGVNVSAGGAGDFFGRGAGAAPDDAPWSGGGGAYNSSGYSTDPALYGTDAGGNSGYGAGNRAMPDDDGYAPQESTGGDTRPGGLQPRYLGSVGGDTGGASDVRNPWDNSQSGYAAPPDRPGTDPYGRAAGGYGAGGDDRGGYGGSGYGANGDRGGAGAAGYGQESGAGNPAGYGAAAYGAATGGDDRGGYGQGGAGYAANDRDGYGAGQGQAQGGYGQPGYGQPGYAGQGADPRGGYGAGADDRGGYGQAQNGYDPNYGGVAPPGPIPATGGTRAPAAGNTAGGRRATPTPQGRERALSYYTEERYWTDYAKLAVPVVIVIALLGGIWFIGARAIGGNGNRTATPAAGTNVAGAATVVGGTRPPGSSGAGVMSPVASGTRPTTLPPVVGPGTQPAGMGTPNPSGMNPPAAPKPTLPMAAVKKFKVANTGGAGANMRAEPSTTATRVTTVPEGTEVQQVGEPQTAADGIWYKVQFGDKTGWIRNDFLVGVDG